MFTSSSDFDAYAQALIKTGCIDNGKKIWWDIRPHPFFSTAEFRICDMPATCDDTITIAALCQALVAKLTWLNRKGLRTPALSSHFIEENKWRAMHYGLDAEVIDFVQGRRLSMRESIGNLLDFVDEVIDDLGSRQEIDYLRRLLEDPRGTGAVHAYLHLDNVTTCHQKCRCKKTGNTGDWQSIIGGMMDMLLCIPMTWKLVVL